MWICNYLNCSSKKNVGPFWDFVLWSTSKICQAFCWNIHWLISVCWKNGLLQILSKLKILILRGLLSSWFWGANEIISFFSRYSWIYSLCNSTAAAVKRQSGTCFDIMRENDEFRFEFSFCIWFGKREQKWELRLTLQDGLNREFIRICIFELMPTSFPDTNTLARDWVLSAYSQSLALKAKLLRFCFKKFFMWT